jgi:hypothetical protein
MNQDLKQAGPKNIWSPPTLTVYGNVEELTQGASGTFGKRPGSGDDILNIQVPGESTFPLPITL